MQRPGSVCIGDREYTPDEHGFLFPPEQWDGAFAEGMAERLGIYDGLTEEHWKFIRYPCKKLLEGKTVPLFVYACADNNLRLGRLACLFPTGYKRRGLSLRRKTGLINFFRDFFVSRSP
jgi:sulfur relay (sulfurtransferase) DsrC/TusE family protein